MLQLKSFLGRFAKDESGAALVEYTILLLLITIAVIGLITQVGDKIVAVWTQLNSTMATATSGLGGG